MSNTARNEITGAWLVSKKPNNAYRAGYDAIFGKKEPVVETPVEEVVVEDKPKKKKKK